MIFAFKSFMKTILLFITALIIASSFSGCFNKNGISAKYYSDCEEYYDMQGYYHKDCGKDDLITYEEIADAFKEPKKEVKNNKNVW